MQEGINMLNIRLKKLRKEKGLTQEQFAERIGIKRNSYTNYEIGRNVPIDAVIHAICREYGASEKWLRTGEGDMYRPVTDEAKVTDWVKGVFADENAKIQQKTLLMLCGLTADQWKRMESAALFLSR